MTSNRFKIILLTLLLLIFPIKVNAELPDLVTINSYRHIADFNVNNGTASQYSHYTTTGADAYCLHAGANFKTGTYKKIANFDEQIGECEKTNDSFYCKLASAILIVKQSYGNDHLAALTALRLLTAAEGELPDDIDSVASNATYVKPIYYKATVDAIRNNNYTGSSSKQGTNVLYAKSEYPLAALKNAISVFNYVNQPNTFSKHRVTFISSTYDEDAKGGLFVFETDFEQSSASSPNVKINKVTLTNGFTASDFTWYPDNALCTNGSSKTCIRVLVSMSKDKYYNGDVSFNATFKYESKKPDIIDQMALYVYKSNPTKSQYFIVFDGSVNTASAKAKVKKTSKCEIKTENNINTYYDNNGNKITGDNAAEKYYQVCGCRIEKGNESDESTWTYYGPNGGVLRNKDEYDNLCKCQVWDDSELKSNKVYFKDDYTITFDEKEFLEVCSAPPRCMQDGDKYYDRTGKEVSYIEYANSCICTRPDENGTTHYINLHLSFTDSNGWSNTCPCGDIEMGGKHFYFNSFGRETTEEDWKNSCNTNTCPTDVISDMPDTCEEKTTGTIKDPSMCSILRSKDSNIKSTYSRKGASYTDKGQSNEFETGKGKYCTIYCRETSKFTFMDKETALAGRYFRYNLKSELPNEGRLYSLLILTEKQCTSLIDYDTWLVDFKKADDAVLEAWNNLKYYESTYNNRNSHNSVSQEKECGSSTSCTSGEGEDATSYTESNEETVYYEDWYWSYLPGEEDDCDSEDSVIRNCYNKTDKDGNESLEVGYKDSSRGSVKCNCPSCTCDSCNSCSPDIIDPEIPNAIFKNYEKAQSTYVEKLLAREKLIYQLEDCNFMQEYKNNEENKKSTTEIINNKAIHTRDTYYIAKDYVQDSSNKSYYTPTSSLKLINYNKLFDNYSTSDRVYIEYEENELLNKSNNEKYYIGKNNEEKIPGELARETSKKYVSKSFSDKTIDEDANICGNCENDLDTSKYFSSLRDYTYEAAISYWVCSGSETDAECHVDAIVVPNNKIANIVIESESRYYQDNEFSTQLYTGRIELASKHNDSKDITQNGWRKLLGKDNLPYLYPVNAYRKTGEYDISVMYDRIGETNRKRLLINNNKNVGKYTCSYLVENALTQYDCTPIYGHVCSSDGNDEGDTYLGVYYRNIDLTNLFPSKNIANNWINATNIINKIQDDGNDIINNPNVKPMYVINLSSSDIANIKRYNKTTDYLDNSLVCNANSYRCTSNFLTNMSNRTLGNYTFGNSYLITGDIEINQKDANSLYYYSGRQ